MMDTLTPWHLSLARERSDLPIPGSPERCIERRVVEDVEGGLWVLERIAPSQVDRRETVARLLDALAEAGLALVPAYRQCNGGGFVQRDGRGLCQQLSPYVAGEPLEVPGYTVEDLPGEELADVLIALRAAADAAGEAGTLPAGVGEFYLAPYIEKLLADMRLHAPDVYPRALGVAERIRPFLDLEPSLPRALCHGDLHPLNAIWRDGHIAAVIDWEFAGLKHALYDVAGTLGCLGIENPRTFACGAGAAMLRRLRTRGLISAEFASLLRPAVAASRFGWLAEWLRKRDAEMAAMELDYLDMLTR